MPRARRFLSCRRFLPVAPLLGLLLSLGPLAATAAPETYAIDPEHTFPMFEVSHLGYSFHRGRFNSTSGTIVLDREAHRGSIDVSIASDSVDTGQDKLEKVLRDKDWFDVANHPALRFRADRLVFKEDRLVAAHGTLSLLGVDQPVTLTLDHFRCATNPATKAFTCGANARASILRSDFGMAKYVPFVGDEVNITIQVEAIRR